MALGVADGELQPKGTAAGVLQTRRDCARARVCPQRAWYLGPTTRALCATGFRLRRWRLAVGVLAAHTIDLHRHGSARQLGRGHGPTHAGCCAPKRPIRETTAPFGLNSMADGHVFVEAADLQYMTLSLWSSCLKTLEFVGFFKTGYKVCDLQL
jgi:hypothetical protein